MTFPGDGDPHPGNIAALVMQCAREFPDSVALIDTEPWSYARLRSRTQAFAKDLARLNLPPETPVGVMMHRTGDMVAALLAIMWSGAAYVPIDPEDPPDRAARILKSAGCSLLLGEADLTSPVRSAFTAADCPRFLDPADLATLGAEATLPDCAQGGDRLAYILFTSGSTGEPKGVEVEHRQLAHLLAAARDLMGITAQDRILAIATIAFDISVFELFLPLILGGSLVLRDRSLLQGPVDFATTLAEHQVTVVQLGPSAWRLILDANAPLPRLHVAITTGEAVSPALAARIAASASAAWNLYGPTETTVWATGHRLLAETPSSDFAAPIGAPLPGCIVRIADDAGNPVAEGQHGELWIGGNGLARGYRDRPDLTSERFVQAADSAERWYRTGDIVNRGPDGAILYKGRNDDQLKIRGVRIEPREVEGAVERMPEVARAAATWFERPGGGRGLVVAVVWHAGSSIPFDLLRVRLAGYLPQVMLPSRFLALPDLPITASGKIDRAAIRSAEAAWAEELPAYGRALSMSETEARLSMIWAKALGVGSTLPSTSFFVEGGDSLSAISMLLDVERAFGVQLETGTLTHAPTLRQFALRVERARQQPDDLRNARTVFPVVSTGDGPPLFFCNIDLRLGNAGQWVAGVPLYGIVQWAYGRGFVRAKSIEQLAAAQVAEIRQVQPSGPYRIGGYSLGGLIALEIARTLQAAGETIELLFLLDPMAPVRFRRQPGGSAEVAKGYVRPPFRQRLRLRLARAGAAPLTALPGELLDTLRRTGLWQAIEYGIVDLHGRRPNRLTRAILPANRWPAFWYAARKLAQDYVASPLDGPSLAVFHQKGEREEIWESLLGSQAKYSLIETDHLGFFTSPALQAWQQVLAQSLESKVVLTKPKAFRT